MKRGAAQPRMPDKAGDRDPVLMRPAPSLGARLSWMSAQNVAVPTLPERTIPNAKGKDVFDKTLAENRERSVVTALVAILFYLLE